MYVNEFLLYPTVSYTKRGYIRSFQDKAFFKDNFLPVGEDKNMELNTMQCWNSVKLDGHPVLSDGEFEKLKADIIIS